MRRGMSVREQTSRWKRMPSYFSRKRAMSVGMKSKANPSALTAQRGDVVQHPLVVLLRPLGVRRQQFPGGIGHHAAGVALEQQAVHLALEARHLPADCRGRHVELQRGFLDGTGAHDFEEVAHGSLLQQIAGHGFELRFRQ
jgi:hypothetical protein